MNLPVPRTTIVSVCAARDKTLAKAIIANEALLSAYELAVEAQQARKAAVLGHQAYGTYDIKNADMPISSTFDMAEYRRSLDADIWTRLINETGMMDMMDKTAKEAFRTSLIKEAPECTEENITATLQSLFLDADLIFARGLAVAFIKLDKRFKSHDGFKIGSRMILERMFDDYGSWNYHTHAEDTLADIERVFAILDGEQPDYRSMRAVINESRKLEYGARQSVTESAYFRINAFKNGNAHLWFTRDDLVAKANLLLANYYGAILPDAYTPNEKPTGTAVSRNLQFYGTPPAVVAILLKDLTLGRRMLEPSAGEGAISFPAARMGLKVTAIEFDPRRAQLSQSLCANFLTQTPNAYYDYVIMNPPFYGTHWIDHVKHAFKFLAPGGKLRAVLPASAELNTEFRKWSKPFEDNWRAWTDLPPESFASSGTRVQTGIMELRKK